MRGVNRTRVRNLPGRKIAEDSEMYGGFRYRNGFVRTLLLNAIAACVFRTIEGIVCSTQQV